MDPSKSHDLKESQSSNKSLSKTHDEYPSHYSPFSESPYPSPYTESPWTSYNSAFVPLTKPFDEDAGTVPPYSQRLSLEPGEEELQLRHGGVHSPSCPSKDQRASNKSEGSKHRNDPKHHAHAKSPKKNPRRKQQISAHAPSQADSTQAHASTSSDNQSRQGTGHAQGHAGADINGLRSGQLQYWLDESGAESPYRGCESFDGGKDY